MARTSCRAILAIFTCAASTVACHDSTGPGGDTTGNFVGDSIVTVAMAGRPHGLAVAPSGAFCVAQTETSSISCGNLDGLSATPRFTSIVVGADPRSVAIDPKGTSAFTANQGSATMTRIDLSGDSVTATVPLSDGGLDLMVDPSGDRIYVTTSSGTLHIIDAATLQVTSTLQVGTAAFGLAYDSTRNVLYVGSILQATVTAIDVAADTILRTYKVGGNPQQLILSPNGSELYVTSQDVGLQILTLADGSVGAVPGVPPGSSGLAMSPDGAYLYVTQMASGALFVVDRRTRHLLHSIYHLGALAELAFNSSGSTLVVTDEDGFVHFLR